MGADKEGKLIVVSNAEPYKHIYGEEGQVLCQEVGGGLTTAMNPRMRKTGGTWIAYGRGEADFEVTDSQGEVMVPENGETNRDSQYVLKRLDFDEGVYDSFYRGYANRILWPICHSFPARADLENESSYWEEGYLPANRKYARAVVETYEPGDRIWIHDYHLALVPQLVKEELPGTEVGVFWHIPWPPWENFFRCVEKLGGNVDRPKGTCNLDPAPLKVGPYPLGVNFPFFDGADTEKKEEFRREYGAEDIILGVDRQDYTKCIPERIRGFEEFIRRYPGYREEVTLIQRTPESRTEIEEYQIERDEINRDVSAFNGCFCHKGTELN